MVTDDPPRNLLPTFAQPTPPPATDPDPSQAQEWGTPGPWAETMIGPGNGRTEPGTPRPDDGPTRTPISSVGKPATGDITKVLVGLLGLAVVGAAWLVRVRTGRKLREPTKTQRHDIAAPIGEILLRHFDLALLTPDLKNALEAATAAGAYIGDGPLLEGPAGPPAPDLPPDLQEAPL